jgi:hypothetical protein
VSVDSGKVSDALEPTARDHAPRDQEAMYSIAISLKRIADALGEESPFLQGLRGHLEDASHNHQQRMRNL